MNELKKYLDCQKFIVISELKFKNNCDKADIASCDFNYKAVECIFDSLEKIAEEIEEIKKEINKK